MVQGWSPLSVTSAGSLSPIFRVIPLFTRISASWPRSPHQRSLWISALPDRNRGVEHGAPQASELVPSLVPGTDQRRKANRYRYQLPLRQAPALANWGQATWGQATWGQNRVLFSTGSAGTAANGRERLMTLHVFAASPHLHGTDLRHYNTWPPLHLLRSDSSEETRDNTYRG